MNKVCLIRNDSAVYPSKTNGFRSHINHPEYMFGEDLSADENCVYEMVREGFRLLGLDKDNYGTKEWNPLGEYIRQGDNVLIKPNMVLHYNALGGGTDCLYTNPSVAAAVIDYVCIALQGTGKIVVGDAPIQDCIFETLIEDSGYSELVDYYKEKGLDIRLVDFRNTKTIEKGNLRYLQEDKKNDGIVVSLDGYSAFRGLSDDRQKGFRITNYDPRILVKHHHGSKHEYKVAKEVLEADVIINMPKPKAHGKAGITSALKNLVGINANKEYLPHHTVGSKEEGGDAYLHSNVFLKRANEILDLKNELMNENEMELAEKADVLYQSLKKKGNDEKYWEGSWYGNDTIWRTILDLNYILLYADKTGIIRDEVQRKTFIVGDMIVSGEKEGPLVPSPIYCGSLAMGDDPIIFDKAVCSVMGFDFNKIPSIALPGMDDLKLKISDNDTAEIISNYDGWNNKGFEYINKNESFNFVPPKGWRETLGDIRMNNVVKNIKHKGGRVYIFGAGDFGKEFAKEFISYGLSVQAFVDNDEIKNGKPVFKDIKCILPEKIDISIPVFIGVSDKYKKEIVDQIKKIGAYLLEY